MDNIARFGRMVSNISTNFVFVVGDGGGGGG
jgi:hypothetical protein